MQKIIGKDVFLKKIKSNFDLLTKSVQKFSPNASTFHWI